MPPKGRVMPDENRPIDLERARAVLDEDHYDLPRGRRGRDAITAASRAT